MNEPRDECPGCGEVRPLGYCHIDEDGEENHTWTTSGWCHCGRLKRCNAWLVNGKRCRRRVDGSKEAECTDYCTRHASQMRAYAKYNQVVIRGMEGKKRKR